MSLSIRIFDGIGNMSELARHLRAEEKVLWIGKPVMKAYFLPALGGIPIAMFFLAFVIAMLFFGEPSGFEWLLPLFVIGGVIVLVFVFVLPIWQLLRFRNTEYVITDQRVIIQSGAIGKDTRFADLDKIQEAHVKVGLVDTWFGTGSIMILTAGQVAMGTIGGDTISWTSPLPKITPNISYIREPYEVMKLLQEAKEKVPTTQTL